MENKEIKKGKVKIVKGKEYTIKPDEYYKNFKNSHPEKNEKQICPICYGSYNYFSKYMHNKSKRHQLAQNERNKIIAPPPSPKLEECLITDTEKSTDIL